MDAIEDYLDFDLFNVKNKKGLIFMGIGIIAVVTYLFVGIHKNINTIPEKAVPEKDKSKKGSD